MKMGYKDGEIFKVYPYKAIIEEYDVDDNTLQEIKKALGNDIKTYSVLKYPIDVVKALGFKDEEIFKVYPYDDICAVYVNKEVEEASEDSYESSGDEDTDKELCDETLKGIKKALGNDIKTHIALKYPIEVVKRLGFKDEEIFKIYTYEAIREEYDVDDDDETLQAIKKALGNDIKTYSVLGYPIEVVKALGFKDEEIFKVYNFWNIRSAYKNDEGKLDDETLQAIKKALGNDIKTYRLLDYTPEILEALGF